MAKIQSDTIFDSGTLKYLRENVTRITVCSGQPSSYSDANSTTGVMLAKSNVLTSTDFLLADGDTSGRKVTPSAQNSVSISKGGTANHVAWICSSSSLLAAVTTCTTQALTSGNTVNIPAHDYEIRDVA